jgi:hypothetical protein
MQIFKKMYYFIVILCYFLAALPFSIPYSELKLLNFKYIPNTWPLLAHAFPKRKCEKLNVLENE